MCVVLGPAGYFMGFLLFLQAWAVFKGKFKEGDKAEPATWKTRLRCALNKSPDFEEVTDRSQLDISEPYKVYRIVPEEEQKCKYPFFMGTRPNGGHLGLGFESLPTGSS